VPDRPLDASALRDWARTAVGDLIAHTDEINRLNVFPVADSDTGTNMLFTMRSALAEAQSAAGSGDVSRVAAALSQGALHGARGNSGVILSQILRGLADQTAAAAAANDGLLTDIDVSLMAASFRRGVALIVSSMGGEMVQGTIVSVLQAAAEQLDEARQENLAQALRAAADAGARALDKTTEQLQVLATAGVVDAGGRGLLVLLDALTVTVGGNAPSRARYEADPVRAEVLTHGYNRPDQGTPDHGPPNFEIMYLLDGAGSGAVEQLRARLEELGDSVGIAAAREDSDGEQAARHSVHVHAADAGAVVEAGLAAGALSRIQISLLTTGSTKLSKNSWDIERAVLAVVDGDGAAELFSHEGANVLQKDLESAGGIPGVTAHQLLHALVETGASQVLVLPNGYVAAEELVAGCTAGIGWGIDVVPLPVGSMVQGLAALAVHDAGRQAVDDGYTMARAAASTRYGVVRLATEHALTWAGACKPGDGLGVAGGEVLVVGSGLEAAAVGLIDLLLTAGGELVTVLVGAEVDPQLAEVLGEHVDGTHLGIEFVAYRTGHHGDALIIGVE
jgi:DAK2 domain fusion protein YloV